MPNRSLLRGLMLALCASALIACGNPVVASVPIEPVPPPATASPIASSAPPAAAFTSPSATAAPPTATAVLPTTTPDPDAPPRVGLQVGHWKIEEHPEEQRRLRTFSGAYYGGYDEWELNILIAEEARAVLEAAGVIVELLPATVPVGYTADAFVSIHVDGATGAEAATRRGWKVATPFRASAASDALAAALADAYPAATGLPPDPQGPSYDMRAYYAFAHYRYWHSIDPATPAVIVETGFMTHPADRALLFERTALVGRGIADGVLAYLAASHPAAAEFRMPVGGPMLRPAADEVALFAKASALSPVLRWVGPAEALVPMARAGDWVLVFTYGGDWDLGWALASGLVPADVPLEPPFPCCGT